MPECLLLGQITGGGDYEGSFDLKLLKILKCSFSKQIQRFHKITKSNVRTTAS